MTPDVNADVRARFEAWASDGGKCPKAVERAGYDDGYRLMATHLYWLAWQAAHADMAGEVRELVEAATVARRELQACQAVIHLCGGFDPAYVRDAQAAMKRLDPALAKFRPTHQEKP